MSDVVVKHQSDDDLQTLMATVTASWGWVDPSDTKTYKEFCSQYSTDYVFYSRNLATPAGYWTMRQIEDYFLMLAGEERGFNKQYISCEYINRNIPLMISWSDQFQQTIRPNEFVMIPIESARAISDDKFERFATEQRNHANIPNADYFRKTEVVPHCEGFAKWLKRWKEETDEQWEYRVIAICLLYANHVRKNSPASSHQKLKDNFNNQQETKNETSV